MGTLAQVNTALKQANEECGHEWDEADVPIEAYLDEQGDINCIVRGEWASPGMYKDVRERAADMLDVNWIGVFMAGTIRTKDMTRLPDA